MDQNKVFRLRDCTIFIVLALGYGGLHVPPNVSVSEVIYALGILFITLYVVFRALKYFKLI